LTKITFPLKLRMQGAKVRDLQTALQLLLDHSAILAHDAAARRELSAALKPERDRKTYGSTTRKLVGIFQQERQLKGRGEVDEATANALIRLLNELDGTDGEQPGFIVKGTVHLVNGSPADGVKVSAFDRDLRSKQELGQTQTDKQGLYKEQ
jgi:hypothetical protein